MASEAAPLLGGIQSPATRPHRCRLVTLVAAVLAVLGVTAIGVWIHSVSSQANSRTQGICGQGKDEPGYITLANGKDNHYFYWFFEALHQPETAPLAIWLTGGPGGSSLLGLFKENGPCTVNKDGLSTQTNVYGWNHRANMIWLDQPTGVGFSFGPEEEIVHNGTKVGENVYWFLQGILDKHPEFRGREFYITGESYAGNYIPNVAHYMHTQNQRNNTDTRQINLLGIAIGNGWSDTPTQYEHAFDIVYDNAYNLTLLGPNEIETVKQAIDECLVAIPQACLPTPAVNGSLCADADGDCYMRVFASVEAYGNRNRFDFRQICEDGVEDYGFCGGIHELETFLNQPHVREYLHTDDPRVGAWVGASEVASSALTANGDDASPVTALIAELADAGIRVLIYVGDADFVCNWYGNLAWMKALEWKGKQRFNDAVETPFLSRDPTRDDAILVNAGVFKAFENFVFLKINNAGHMIPTHPPAVALDLINRFFFNASFQE